MSESKEFQLGQVYRDGITGVIGLAVAIYNDISGEQSVKLQPQSIDGLKAEREVWANLKFLQGTSEEPTGETATEGTTEEV